MIKAKFYINGNSVIVPNNYQELALELNFDKDDPSYRGEVSVNSWEFGLGSNKNDDSLRKIKNYIDAGLTGGEGVFQGLPLSIAIDNGLSEDTIFDGFMDLTQSEIFCDKAVVSTKEIGGIDWLNEVADSFTFEYLATPLSDGGVGLINNNDYVYVPYLVQKDFSSTDLAIMILTATAIVLEFLDIINGIIGLVAGFASEPVVWALVVQAIVMFFRLIIALSLVIGLIKQLISVLYHRVKYAAGMYILDLCKFGADYLGMDFKSETILEKDVWRRVCLLSQTFQTEANAANVRRGLLKKLAQVNYGVYSLRDKGKLKGFYRGTFGQLLRELKDVFNAKVIIEDGVNGGRKTLRLEMNNFNNSSNLYKLPPVDKSELGYRFNSDDFAGSYKISFTPDLQDKHVWQNYTGTSFEVVTAPKIQSSNVGALLMKNNIDITIPYSLATRKEELNNLEIILDDINEFIADILQPFETVVNVFVDAINKLIKAVNKIFNVVRTVIGKKAATSKPKYLNRMNAVHLLRTRVERKRLYVMLMEQDFINTTKMLMTNFSNEIGTKDAFRDKLKIDDLNKSMVNAEQIYNEFHYYNSFFDDSNGIQYPNQYKIYSIDKIPFCYEDYLKVRDSNYFYDSDGITVGEIISLKWNIYEQTASIKYKKKEIYTTNLKQYKILSDGR